MTPCVDHGCKGFGLGYATAWVVKDNKRFTTTKHRKVHYELTGEWPEVVRHKCDNPRCINPEHLEGGTHKDNCDDKHKRGRYRCRADAGEYSPSSKVTDATVAAIRAEYIKGSREFGLPALARKYGLGTSQIHRITRGQSRTASYSRIQDDTGATASLVGYAGPQAGDAVPAV